MGGDCWEKTGPYQQNIAAAFRQAQEQELATGIHDRSGRTIDELWEDPEWQESIFTGGTGTTLDFFELSIGEGHQNEGGRMRLLTDAEVKTWAPDGKPTYADWQNALRHRDLFDLDRACGNCTVLYRDGEPAEIGYWGRHSGLDARVLGRRQPRQRLLGAQPLLPLIEKASLLEECRRRRLLRRLCGN